MRYAVKLPKPFLRHRVVTYTESDGTVTFEVLPPERKSGPFARHGERLESLGEIVGVVFTFDLKEGHREET
ncbi:MAG: hypothetical protein U0798_15320 [Gemmataceae bacterium]